MKILKKLLLGPYKIFRNMFFDPLATARRIVGLPYFYINMYSYFRTNQDSRFPLSLVGLMYRSYDRFSKAGTIPEHYFLQDIWAARYVYKSKVDAIVDVGSRVDGYIGHVLPFCSVTMVDIRPLSVPVENLRFIHGSITSLPFESNSVKMLSTLHVLEHIGLGRYGDMVDALGPQKAAAEITRVLSPGGKVVLGTVVGKERLCFDAHRVFSPETICQLFSQLKLVSFSLIDDVGHRIIEGPDFALAGTCDCGCGLFVFEKK